MNQIESRINPRAPAFLANAEHYQQLVDTLRGRLREAATGIREAHIARHRSRGNPAPVTARPGR